MKSSMLVEYKIEGVVAKKTSKVFSISFFAIQGKVKPDFTISHCLTNTTDDDECEIETSDYKAFLSMKLSSICIHPKYFQLH